MSNVAEGHHTVSGRATTPRVGGIVAESVLSTMATSIVVDERQSIPCLKISGKDLRKVVLRPGRFCCIGNVGNVATMALAHQAHLASFVASAFSQSSCSSCHEAASKSHCLLQVVDSQQQNGCH